MKEAYTKKEILKQEERVRIAKEKKEKNEEE